MRILILSDSHGKPGNILRALEEQPTANTVIHLGDGERDMHSIEKELQGRQVFQVSGNCDFCPFSPDERAEIIGGIPFYLCHGHKFYVKGGTGPLWNEARRRGCKAALFGHTHVGVTEYRDGIYLMNPGSIGTGTNPTYGIIDIAQNGIFCNIIPLYRNTPKP